MAKSMGFLVILRPGPYICGERDFGGFPPWILKNNPNMKVRTSELDYTKHVDNWYRILLPSIRQFLYINGGPIIMVQIENEYGLFSACDFAYMAWLRDTTKKYLIDQVVLFTNDPSLDSSLKCGKVSEVYATVDFGIDVEPSEGFAAQRRHQARGPLVNSELYPGWLDHWGERHSIVATDDFIFRFKQILSLNASVNV